MEFDDWPHKAVGLIFALGGPGDVSLLVATVAERRESHFAEHLFFFPVSACFSW